MTQPIVLAWSGGKDSAWMLHMLRADPRWHVCALLTSVDAGSGAVAVHRLPRALLDAQASAAALPLLAMPLPANPDNAAYEAAFAAALATLRRRWPALRHIAFGDLFLADVRAWREALCARLGWNAVFPLWASDTAALAREMIDGSLRATLCCVDTTQLDAAFAGRDFDHGLLDALPPRIDPCGEQGEFHTAVRGGPMFAAPIALRATHRITRDARFIYATPETLESANDPHGDMPWPSVTT
ncbi:ATP-binding protein [Chiayiivirga flava]|uniref:Uncharacterized protein (TIGR00290 family) n=1 Tax=Chiayiivirga flava TaxID=659595 RepID=A0A7W8D646_9GAMM|nr:ATP-binding protein [Chiayiivirga flava]MBB5207406.1 uncharacterized protein (TIGR00290 family) [Chiayiivirga flava]